MESEESTTAMASEEEKAPPTSPGNSSIVSSASHSTAATDAQYPQLQNELTMLKEQLFEAEAGFRRRKTILEQEIQDNESAAQSKIEQFQSKFVQLTEEARRSENSYKSEIFLLEESIAQLESAWQARLDHLEQRMRQQNEGQRTELERLFGVVEQRFTQLKESQNQERELLSDHVELSLAQQNEIHGKDIERIIDRSIQRENQLAQRMEQEKLARDKEIAALVNHIGENDSKIKATGADHRAEFLLLESSIQKQKEAHKREIDNLIGVLHQQEDVLRATNEDHETLKQSMAKENSMLQTYLRHIEQTLAQQNENHQKEIERVTSQANQKEEAVTQLLAQQKAGQDRAANRILDHVKKVMEQQKEVHENEISAFAKHVSKNEHETRKLNEAQKAAMAQLEQRLEEEKMYRTEEVESLNMHLSQLREELSMAREEKEALKEAKEESTFQALVQNLMGTIKEHADSFEDYKVEQQQVKADFQATLSSHRNWFKELEQSIKQQSIDILAASDEFNAGKDDVETMVRSWISEYENMHQEVEGISDEIESTKMQVQSTNESFDQLRENVEKLGESWEALFEHMASQVQEETIERKAADKEQESMHKTLEGMIEVRNDDVDEQISRIVQAANEQKTTTDKIQESIDKHDDEIVMLQQIMGASNLQMETFEKKFNEQADGQTLTRNECADLKTTVSKLHVDGQDRIKSLEDKIAQDSSEQAETSAKLERELQAHGARLDSMDEQLTRHDSSVEELGSKTHQMKEQDTKRSIEAAESTRETAELIQTRKVELDGLKSTLEALQKNWGASSAQIETVEKKLKAQAQLQSSTNANMEDLTEQVGILEKTSESRFNLLETKTAQHLEDQASKSEQLESEIFKHESHFNSVHDQLARFDSTFPELLKKVQQQESAHLALGENLAQAQQTRNEQFETCRDEIAELATRVRDRADKQSATNDAVRKGLKTHKLSLSALQVAVSESFMKVDVIPKLLQEQESDHKAAIAVVQSNFDERIGSKIGEVTMHLEQVELKTDERLTATEAKLETNLVEQEAKFTKLGANLVTVNNKVGKLKQDIAKQADLLNTAKKARAVIRSDMLSMMRSLKAQDDHLAQQLKEKAESLDAKENMLETSLEEQRAEHQLLKRNLERYQTEVRKQHETGIRGLDAKLLAATSSLGNLQNAAESKAKDLARFEERLRSAEEQQSKYNAEARERLEEGLRNLEVKLQAQDEELAQQLKEQIVGLDATDSILTKSMEEQRAEHQLLKRKLELYNKELREMQETATISLRELENAVKTQASEQTSSNEALEEVNSNLTIAATCLKELEDTVMKQSSEQMATKEAFEKFSSQLRARLEWVEGHQKKNSKELREQHETGLHQLNSELSVVMTNLREIEETALTQASEQMAMKEVLEKASSQLESRLYTVEGHQKKTSEELREQHEAVLLDIESRRDVSTSGNLEQLSKEVYDRLDFVEVQQSKTMKAVEQMDYQLKHHTDLEREQPEVARAETPEDADHVIRDTKKKQNSGLKKRREEIKDLIASARSDVCFSITEGDDESRDSSSVARE